MEISRRGESLADELGADDLAVALNQTSLRLMRKKNVGQPRHRERVDQSRVRIVSTMVILIDIINARI